jgi:hypothetical protein
MDLTHLCGKAVWRALLFSAASLEVTYARAECGRKKKRQERKNKNRKERQAFETIRAFTATGAFARQHNVEPWKQASGDPDRFCQINVNGANAAQS